MRQLLWLVPVVLLALALPAGARQAVCPDDGGWVKVDSGDLSLYPVAGAVEYCFKAGSDQSEGCEGGLFDSWPQPEGTCGLSHWSYRLGEATATTVATPTEVPTETPTLEPTSTGTPEPTSAPSVTPTPNQLTETPDIACRDEAGEVVEGCHYGKG